MEKRPRVAPLLLSSAFGHTVRVAGCSGPVRTHRRESLGSPKVQGSSRAFSGTPLTWGKPGDATARVAASAMGSAGSPSAMGVIIGGVHDRALVPRWLVFGLAMCDAATCRCRASQGGPPAESLQGVFGCHAGLSGRLRNFRKLTVPVTVVRRDRNALKDGAPPHVLRDRFEGSDFMLRQCPTRDFAFRSRPFVSRLGWFLPPNSRSHRWP